MSSHETIPALARSLDERAVSVPLNEQLREMFDQAPGFMALLTGPEHTFTLANQAYLDLVGNRDVIGKSVAEILPEAVEQGFVELLNDLFATGKPYRGASLPFSTKATSVAPAKDSFVDFVYQPIRGHDGSITGIFVQGADVSERVKAERENTANQAKFQVWAQAMPNHVWSATPDGLLDWFNDRVYAYSGAGNGTLDGKAWASIVHPVDLPFAAQLWESALRDHVTYETEFRLRRHDGCFRWHLTRAVPIVGPDGALTGWIGTNTDIDDQKAAALALENLNATLADTVSTRTAQRDRMWRLSTDIMLVANFAAEIISVNPAFNRILGWRENDSLGKSFLDFVHPDDKAATLDQIGALGAGATTFRFENRFRRQDGSYCVLSWSASPDQEFIHAVGRDITADRLAAESMRQTELALQQSQKMETIGKLTGGVAHDFNNLLQVISGNLQLLASDVAGNDKAMRRVRNAMSGVERGAKLASYLLAFGRRQALDPKVVKVSQYIVGMEDMLRRSLGEEIEIETICSGGLWNTLIDTAQIENAVLNLAINARDAMDGAGKLTIEVSNAKLDDMYAAQHPEVSAGQYVMLAVSDTGTGMTPDVVSQAFEPFFSTKEEGKGTGLGLSMVYGFVKQSGGHVKIYSEPGHGTTVKLYIPRSFDDEAAQPLAAEVIFTGGTETILVAEDDVEVRNTVVELLTELGYRVLKASDATAALGVIDSGIPIDLLFTDVVMPGPLRSPELARKARERMPDLAVLFTSGYTENAIVHGGRLDAGVELLGKPYTKEALAKKIRHVLANQKQKLVNISTVELLRQRARSASTDERSAPAPLRILLVEDNVDVAEMTVEILKILGYLVELAVDGPKALSALRRTPFDIMITDIGLPGMPGDILARHAVELAPELKVIFATGRMPDLADSDALVLLKPFSLDAIIACVNKAMDLKVK
ncbi:MAG: PAS domain S-box protein [Pseudomonadota bacterium]